MKKATHKVFRKVEHLRSQVTLTSRVHDQSPKLMCCFCFITILRDLLNESALDFPIAAYVN